MDLYRKHVAAVCYQILLFERLKYPWTIIVEIFPGLSHHQMTLNLKALVLVLLNQIQSIFPPTFHLNLSAALLLWSTQDDLIKEMEDEMATLYKSGIYMDFDPWTARHEC